MSNIVRGGQNLLHYFRMFDQVAKSLFLTAISTTFLVSGYILHQNIRLYDLKIYLIYLLSKAYVGINIKNSIISFNNSHGILNKSKAIDIVNNLEVIRLYDNINQQVIISTISGLKWGIIVAFIALIAFALKGASISKKRTLKGKDLVTAFKLKQQIFFYNLKRLCFKPVTIANIPFPKHHEKTHTLITGASGTGKTVIMSDLISQVRAKKQKAIIYDKMGVYVERFYDPNTDILLNPLDARSANWNLLQECSKSSSLASTLNTISKAFIPSTKSNDPFWENAARIVFSETLNYLKKQGKTDNKSLQQIYFGKDQSEFNHIIQSSGILNKILSKDNERTTGSILSVMISYVRCLKYLSPDNHSQNFSIKDWIEDDSKQGFLIISSNANQHETLKPLISVFLELAINNLLSLKQNRDRRIWLFLDELPSLHYLPSLQSGLSESRQFGGSFILSLQLMAQLRSIYGHDLTMSVSGLCRNRVVFSTPDEETANWCAGSLGKIEVEEIKENYSYGASQMRDGVSLTKVQQIRPIVLPTEIMNLEDLSCYVNFSGFPLTKSKIKYHKYPNIAERFVEIIAEELNPKSLSPVDKKDSEHIKNSDPILQIKNINLEELKPGIEELVLEETEFETEFEDNNKVNDYEEIKYNQDQSNLTKNTNLF